MNASGRCYLLIFLVLLTPADDLAAAGTADPDDDTRAAANNEFVHVTDPQQREPSPRDGTPANVPHSLGPTAPPEGLPAEAARPTLFRPDLLYHLKSLRR
jgi:hypothetical protein